MSSYHGSFALGGYNSPNAARAWAHLTSIAVWIKLATLYYSTDSPSIDRSSFISRNTHSRSLFFPSLRTLIHPWRAARKHAGRKYCWLSWRSRLSFLRNCGNYLGEDSFHVPVIYFRNFSYIDTAWVADVRIRTTMFVPPSQLGPWAFFSV